MQEIKEKLQQSIENRGINFPLDIIDSVDKLNNYLQNVDAGTVAIDTETAGFYGKVRLIQLFNGKSLGLIDMKYFKSNTTLLIDSSMVEYNAKLLDIIGIFNKYNILWVGANIKYEFKVLGWHPTKWADVLAAGQIAFYAYRPKNNTLDTFARIIYSNAYDNIDKKVMQKKGFGLEEELTPEHYEYALLDAYYTYAIFFSPKVQAVFHNNTAFFLDNSLIPTIMQVEENGLMVDKVAVAKEIAKIEIELMQYEDILGGINPNSWQQVRKALNSTESDETALLKIVAENSERSKLAEAILQVRKLRKAKVMLEAYANTDENNKVYTNFNISGAVTGRMSSSGKFLKHGINAQQIPRKYKHIFMFNTEDTIAVNIDFSTAELRMGAAVMNEKVMAEELTQKLDIHKVTAAALNGNIPLEQVTKEQRQIAKGINFGLLFAMGAERFQQYMFTSYGISITLEEANKYREFYLGKYKNIAKYAKYWWNNYKTEPVVSPLGRKKMANMGTDAVNYSTQSGISETTKLSLRRISKFYPEYLKYIFNIVHDSINLRIPISKDYKTIIENVSKEMLRAWVDIQNSKIVHIKTIPMAVEYEYIDIDGTKVSKELWSDIDI